jgi:hypothetical protein
MSPVRTFADGGMHPSFLAAVQPYNVDSDGVVRARVSAPAGTIPANIRLPGERTAARSTGSVSEPGGAAEPSRSRLAAAEPGSGGGLFSNLFSSSGGGMMDRMSALIGLGGAQPEAKAASKAKAPPKKPAANPRPRPTDTKQSETKQAVAKSNAGAIRPQPKDASPASAEAAPPAAQEAVAAPPAQAQTANAGQLRGAQPAIPSGGFDNRFGAWR